MADQLEWTCLGQGEQLGTLETQAEAQYYDIVQLRDLWCEGLETIQESIEHFKANTTMPVPLATSTPNSKPEDNLQEDSDRWPHKATMGSTMEELFTGGTDVSEDPRCPPSARTVHFADQPPTPSPRSDP